MYRYRYIYIYIKDGFKKGKDAKVKRNSRVLSRGADEGKHLLHQLVCSDTRPPDTV